MIHPPAYCRHMNSNLTPPMSGPELIRHIMALRRANRKRREPAVPAIPLVSTNEPADFLFIDDGQGGMIVRPAASRVAQPMAA
jgi:hypothetical protein